MSVSSSGRGPVDVVLSSGWLAFAAHTGFLAALEDAGVAVEGVCGTSSGALTGALWAGGMPAREVLDLLSARRPLSWVRPHLSVGRGLLVLDAMVAELERHLPARFEGLQRPLGLGVVTVAGEHRVLTAGPLPVAVAASCAVPRLFRPVGVGGVDYVDGGAADRLGLRAWRQHRPAAQHWVHLVDRTAGAPVEDGLEGCTVVRSPRSGAQLWSLGDVATRFERARQAANRAIQQQGGAAAWA